MVKVWRDLQPQEVIWYNCPAQAGAPTASSPGPCLDGLNISRHGDSTASGQLVRALTMKNYFLAFKGSLLYFSLWQSPLVISQGTTEKSLALSLCPLFRHWYPVIRPSLNLLFSRWNGPSSSRLKRELKLHNGARFADIFVTSTWSKFVSKYIYKIWIYLTLICRKILPLSFMGL